VLLGANPTLAQRGATLAGTVKDSAGNPLSGVEVRVTGSATGETSRTTPSTASSGLDNGQTTTSICVAPTVQPCLQQPSRPGRVRWRAARGGRMPTNLLTISLTIVAVFVLLGLAGRWL